MKTSTACGVPAMIHRHLNYRKNPGARVTILPPGALAAWKRRDQERDRLRVAEGGLSMAAVWREIAKTETFEILHDPTMEGLDEKRTRFARLVGLGVARASEPEDEDDRSRPR